MGKDKAKYWGLFSDFDQTGDLGKRSYKQLPTAAEVKEAVQAAPEVLARTATAANLKFQEVRLATMRHALRKDQEWTKAQEKQFRANVIVQKQVREEANRNFKATMEEATTGIDAYMGGDQMVDIWEGHMTEVGRSGLTEGSKVVSADLAVISSGSKLTVGKKVERILSSQVDRAFAAHSCAESQYHAVRAKKEES